MIFLVTNLIAYKFSIQKLIFEILEFTYYKTSVDLIISETVTITYEGKQIHYQKDQVLKQIWNNLVEKTEGQNNRWIIQLHKEPCVNFTNQK